MTRVGSSTRPAPAPSACQWEASGRTGITSTDRGTTPPAGMVAIAEATSGVGPALFGKAKKTSGHGMKKIMLVGARNSSMQGAARSGSLGGKTARTRRSHTTTLGDAAACPSFPDALI